MTARSPLAPRIAIAVAGVSGNGKTTLSRRLAAKLDVRHIELDALCHLPNWRESTNQDFRRAVLEAIAPGGGYVIDGTYDRKLGNLVYEHVDTVVWLDLPLPLVLYRLIGRALRDIITQRDLFNGNRQTWRYAFFEKDSLVSYAIKQHYRRRETWPSRFAEMKDVELIRLRTPHEVKRWLETVRR